MDRAAHVEESDLDAFVILEDEFATMSKLFRTRSTQRVLKKAGHTQERGIHIQEEGSTYGSTVPSLGAIPQFSATARGKALAIEATDSEARLRSFVGSSRQEAAWREFSGQHPTLPSGP